MHQRIVVAAALAALLAAPAVAQAPDTVFLDEHTWIEVRELIDAGAVGVPE